MKRHPRTWKRLAAALVAAAAVPAGAAAPPVTIAEAIRAAWAENAGLRASSAQVEAARAEAARARAGHLPTVSLSVRGVRTDEPMMAFGLKLDQSRITQEDFAPARLNDPQAIGGWGAGATLNLPVYMGGRVSAGSRAAGAMAGAEAASHERRRLETAVAVVEAYFGAQAAEQGVRYAEDLLAQAKETERFMRERGAQGLALDADVARAAAFRAQAEAERATALQRRASARSGLALVAGDAVAEADLTTPIGELPPPPAVAPDAPPPPERPDLVAARLQRDAADAGVGVARGSLLPSLFAQASAETLREGDDLSSGGSWTTLGLMLRWDLSIADARATRAAQARVRAAEEALRWREREAAREVGEARRAVETADARTRSAEEAVTASESARQLRRARHRQGLLPLTDVLDAEAGLAGARALLLGSRLEARVARARLALALHQPIEGITP
ncbi:TolC family protein [Anaeromyxobacter sp. Fw109-5]|uniref:TolC family protein n=1 Tax=Anaeromyxobacter sp. (strain Fw109-5) TaxID=404589 RepID=UPI0000ED7632|nr:TolC family protein [Anaeromyxobacter sp. Fw109-5]ABS25894.1 outer membrane efflux protein [Anaeromyxobacter sp. Fw109-5]